MDNLYDPLADLLSEGSNDSFFEESKFNSSKAKSNKTIANVFDLNDDSKVIQKNNIPLKEEVKISDESVHTTLHQPTSKVSLVVEERERKLSFDQDDVNDLLSSNEVKKSKSSVMNEILGISNTEQSKPFSFDDILQSSSISKRETKKFIDDTQTSDTTSLVTSNFTINKEPRRVRRNSANLDPLGILNLSQNISNENQKKEIGEKSKDKNNSGFAMQVSKSDGVINAVKNISVSETEQQNLAKSSKSVGFLGTASTFSGLTQRSTKFSESLVDKAHEKSDILTKPSKSVGFLGTEIVRKKQQRNLDLPDWLGGSQKSQPSESIATDKVTETSLVTIKQAPELNTYVPNTQEVKSTEYLSTSSNTLETLLQQQKISTNAELQSSAISLQQQESQLIRALQLKKYEQNLADLQRTQQEMLVKQEQQFNLLIEQQFLKQQSMEDNMRDQQQRINNHIQLLLSQPTSSGMKHTLEEQQRKEEVLRDTFEENRSFYSDIINSLKQKHKEEIIILEDSYKKQISFLELSLESTENRLKSEIDSINSYFNSKLSDVSNKQADIINEYEIKIKKNHDQNELIITEIKENYNEMVKEIKNEYKLIIDDLNNSKSRDAEIINHAGIFTEKLNTNVQILNNNTDMITEMQTVMRNERISINDIRTQSLNAKEEEVKMMQSSLEKQRVSSENERAQLLALIRTLEIRLVEQTQAAREERWTLQQASATLAARALAMDREGEYMKNNLEYEREHLKNLKETYLAEHEKMIMQLTEEKLSIAAEKSHLETRAKLNQNFDTNKARVEIEAALNVAKEATELTDRERDNLCRKQSELETLKRILQDRERKQMMKEQELEHMRNVAEQKYKDGEKCMVEAKVIESKFTERMKSFQRHSLTLANREKKLAEEKIALSKERLSMHNNLQQNKCSLCKVDGFQNNEGSIHDENIYVEHDKNNASITVVDYELERLKYEIEDNIPTLINNIME